MRRDRPMPRTLLKPEELVRIFLGAHQRGWCQGLFITTGIPGRPVKVMDDLIQVLELLRERHRFGGYIHVKLVAGSETSQIDRLTALASRVSLNFEAPCGKSLAQIAPDKSFSTTLHDFERVRSLVVREREAQAHGKPRDPLHPGGASGMTMQFVVGATPDTDRSCSAPSAGSRPAAACTTRTSARSVPSATRRWKNAPATPALREHRLYQAAYLLRGYGFAPDEVVYEPNGNLPLALDPKSAWALAHPERFPVEVQRRLLRGAGAGAGHRARGRAPDRRPARARCRFRGLADLRKLGVVTTRAGGFLTLRGRRLQTTRWTEQLGFWAPEDDVGTHHMVYQVSPGTFR